MKLDTGQKHILAIINRDKKSDGWTSVSSQLYKPLKETTPSELATFEQVGESYRVMLTTEGQNILRAMEWL